MPHLPPDLFLLRLAERRSRTKRTYFPTEVPRVGRPRAAATVTNADLRPFRACGRLFVTPWTLEGDKIRAFALILPNTYYIFCAFVSKTLRKMVQASRRGGRVHEEEKHEEEKVC